MASFVIHLIAAVRPNFMKVAPLYHRLRKEAWCTPCLVHTGQHYDENMSDAFFTDLNLPSPDFHLGVGSGTHSEQTGRVMMAYEKLCFDQRPDLVVVVGDVNSTLACALVAAKLCIPFAHLEAGLRSRDRSMPEEINRIVTDALGDILWTPSTDADQNLKDEGVSEDRIERVGNIMIDALELMRGAIERQDAPQSFSLEPGNYGVVTLHRPSNVDDQATLTEIVKELCLVAQTVPIIFAIHPRTRANLCRYNLMGEMEETPNVILSEPLGYLDFMSLVMSAKFLITDSGGIQEEATYLSIPCLTLRENTERPITVTEGTNQLIRPNSLSSNVAAIMQGNWPKGHRPDLWDGHTAERIVKNLRHRYKAS